MDNKTIIKSEIDVKIRPDKLPYLYSNLQTKNHKLGRISVSKLNQSNINSSSFNLNSNNISLNPLNNISQNSKANKLNRADYSPIGSPTTTSSNTGLLSNKQSSSYLNKHKISHNIKSNNTLHTNESSSSLIIKKNCNQISNVNINVQLPILEQEKLLVMDKNELLNEIKY